MYLFNIFIVICLVYVLSDDKPKPRREEGK